MSMPGIDCCAALDGAFAVCPHATLHISKVKKIVIRFMKPPHSRLILILTLPQEECFFNEELVTPDYTGNPHVGGLARFLVHLTP
jgi:hypothetical protein